MVLHDPLSSIHCQLDSSGGNDGKDTPVPIPNTVVKLPSAEDTWTVASRENRSLPDLYQSLVLIAQGFAYYFLNKY